MYKAVVQGSKVVYQFEFLNTRLLELLSIQLLNWMSAYKEHIFFKNQKSKVHAKINTECICNVFPPCVVYIKGYCTGANIMCKKCNEAVFRRDYRHKVNPGDC